MSASSPHSIPRKTVVFFSALGELMEEYNALADRIEEAWADNQRLEEQLEALHEALVAADTFWAKPDTESARRAQTLADAALGGHDG